MNAIQRSIEVLEARIVKREGKIKITQDLIEGDKKALADLKKVAKSKAKKKKK